MNGASSTRVVRRALRRRLRAPRGAGGGIALVVGTLRRHRPGRRSARLRQRAVAVGLRPRDRQRGVRRRHRTRARTGPAPGRGPHRRGLAPAARPPARHARPHARGPADRQHHLERPAGRDARVRAAVRPHPRGDPDPPSPARRRAGRPPRRVVRPRGRPAVGAHGVGTLPAAVLRWPLRTRPRGRRRRGRRLPALARHAARRRRDPRRPPRAGRASRTHAAVRVSRARDRA